MFRGQPDATWCACHVSICCHSCRCVVFITSSVSMALCTVFGWTRCCVSGSRGDITHSCQSLAVRWEILCPNTDTGVWGKQRKICSKANGDVTTLLMFWSDNDVTTFTNALWMISIFVFHLLYLLLFCELCSLFIGYMMKTTSLPAHVNRSRESNFSPHSWHCCTFLL